MAPSSDVAVGPSITTWTSLFFAGGAFFVLALRLEEQKFKSLAAPTDGFCPKMPTKGKTLWAKTSSGRGEELYPLESLKGQRGL